MSHIGNILQKNCVALDNGTSTELQRSHGLPEHSMKVRPIPAADYLGYESYIHDSDPLVDWVGTKIETLSSRKKNNRPLVVEVGGASGFQAMSLAMRGYNVKIIDRVGEKKIIDARNDLLACEKSSTGKIDLYVADVRKIRKTKLKKICNGQRPWAVLGLQVIHFLQGEELPDFFKMFSGIAAHGALLGLSYCRPSRLEGKNMFFHNPEKVTSIAEKHRFRLLKQLPELPEQYGLTRQVYRLDF